jgi:hypothetical protein
MNSSTVRYAFLLFALLIVVSYFIGAATDTNTLASSVTKVVFAVTGRTSSGKYAGYPAGATQVQMG